MKHYAHRQTKTQNRRAFESWLRDCRDTALDQDAASIARSYGLDVQEVASEVLREKFRRSVRDA